LYDKNRGIQKEIIHEDTHVPWIRRDSSSYFGKSNCAEKSNSNSRLNKTKKKREPLLDPTFCWNFKWTELGNSKHPYVNVGRISQK